MHSTLVFWWYWIEFLLSSTWKNRPFKGWIEKAFVRCLAICEKVSHTSKTALTLHGFCPPALQKSRLNPHWRSALFHSSYSTFRNSMCFGSTWSRSLMLQIHLFASIQRLKRICPQKWILGFLVGVRMFGFFSASLELMWLCMGNFESTAWPNHFWPLQICGAVQILILQEAIITPKSFGNLRSARPIVTICLGWRHRNLRASAQLRNAVYLWKWVNKLCFPPALFEVGFPGGCADGGIAGGGIRIVTSAGDTSVELEDSLVNPSANGWSHSGKSVSARRSWSPTACAFFRSPRTWVWCSVACTVGPQRACVCRFHNRLSYHFFWWDMTADLDAIHASNRFLHNLHSESTAGDSFKSSTWINVSKSLIFSVSFSVVWAVPLAVIITGGTFEFLNRSLFFWSLITFTHHMMWSSRVHNELILSLSFDEVTEGEDTLLAGPGLKNLCRFSEYEPETLYKFVCKIQAAILAVSSKFKVYSIDSIFDVADFEVQSGWLPEQVLISPLWERTCSRDAEVSLEKGSCHPTELSVITSVSHHSMECQ